MSAKRIVRTAILLILLVLLTGCAGMEPLFVGPVAQDPPVAAPPTAEVPDEQPAPVDDPVTESPAPEAADPSPAEANLEAAIVALESGDAGTAVMILDELLAAHPDLTDAYFYRGVALSLPTSATSDGIRAVTDLSRVLDAEPDRVEAAWIIAYLFMNGMVPPAPGDQGDVQYQLNLEIREQLSDSDKLDTDLLALAAFDAQFGYFMGMGQMIDGHVALFLTNLEESPDLVKEYYLVWLALSLFTEAPTVDSALVEETLLVANALLEENPEYADAYAVRGAALIWQGEADQAKTDFDQFLALAQDDVDFMNLMTGVDAEMMISALNDLIEPFDRNEPLNQYRRFLQITGRMFLSIWMGMVG